ncbi:MAG: DUF3106 domain-containing protein [Aquabacterium sp.]|nr:DUF3106 domain-containing protein [Aquabacterium sp.]
MPVLIRLLTLALLAVAGTGTGAQPAQPAPVAAGDADGPGWASLSGEQRSVLAPLLRDWHTIDAPRKAKWLEVAARFPSMPAEERQRVQERMAEWARMTPSERGRARLTFQESKQLTREQKQERWEAYQALPDEKRQALADRARPAADARKAQPGAAEPNASAPKKTAETLRAGASAPLLKPVAPTIVQAKPGATTTLMTQQVVPPAHQQPGQPKIAGQPDQVNRQTLLPQRGPQAAAGTASAPRRP